MHSVHYLVLLITILCSSAVGREPFKVVGAFNIWEVPTQEEIDSLNFEGLTHLGLAPLMTTAEGDLQFFCLNADTSEVKEAFKVLAQKARAQGVKPFISFFDWTGNGWEMTKSKESRANFIENIVALCTEWNLAGIDLDLEGTAVEYAWNDVGTFFPEPYESLAVELREALPDSFYLSSAVGPDAKRNKQWTDTFLEQIDFLNVMVYNMRLGWKGSPIGNHSSYDDHKEAFEVWRKRNITPDQIVLGMPFYARGWDRDNNTPYREESPELGIMAEFRYRDFVHRYNLTPAMDTFHITPAETLVEGNSKIDTINGNATIYFNGRDMVEKKTRWAKDSSAAGGVFMLDLRCDVPRSDSMSLLQRMIDVAEEETALVSEMQSSAVSSSISLRSHSKQELQLSLATGGRYTIRLFNGRGQQVYTVDREAFSKGLNRVVLPTALSEGIYVCTVSSDRLRADFIVTVQ